MDEKHTSAIQKSTKQTRSMFKIILVIFLFVVVAATLFISLYEPGSRVAPPKVTLEQKLAHLETGTPLPGQNTRPEVPRWMMIMILGFIVMQIFPLVLASHKARNSKLTARDLRQIEFLTETPLFLGLLGSLLGVSLTHFISGTLSAPLAYLTTISGILIYLLGRFVILLSLPCSTESSVE